MDGHNKLLRIFSLFLVCHYVVAIRDQDSHWRAGKVQRRHRQHRNQPEQGDRGGSGIGSSLATSTTTTTTSAAPDKLWTDKQIVEELLKKYRFPEPSTNISVAVLLEIERVLSAETVDDLCRLQLLITQKWLEPRLEYKNLRDSPQPIRLRSLSYVWNPSLNVDNALSVLPIGKDSLKIFSGGVVEYVQRIQVITAAETNLHSFPFENRNCTLVLTNDDPRAIWSRVLSIALPQDHSHPAALADFFVSDARMREYRHVEVCLKRCLHSWITWLFAPTAVLLFASWLCSTCSCLLSFHPIARMLLSITCFSAILFITSTPRTNEWTALEQWIISARAAAFLAILNACVGAKNSAFSNEDIEKRVQCFEQNEGKGHWMNSSGTHRQSYSSGKQLPYYAQLINNGQKKSYTRVLLAQLMSLTMKMVGPLLFFTYQLYFITIFVSPYHNAK